MKGVLLAAILACCVHFCYGQQQPIPLYEGEVPNSKKAPANYIENTDSDGVISKVTHPTITAYLPPKGMATGTAVIIFPGGGYKVVASGTEIADIAKAFNKIGVAAFELKYRLPSDDIMADKTIGPLQDAQKALAIVRKRAAAWGINPAKVGFMGISAGGHIASTAGTHYQAPVIDNKEKINLRPDFMILLYPVIVFDSLIPSGTRERLIGRSPSAATLDFFSNEKHVTANTPPTFLIHAADDTVVPVKNSLLFFNALANAKVKAGMHIFQAGGHGFDLNNPTSKDKWFDQCRNWLEENGF
ncbi:alpha/beta hydrolase [Chitinophaga sp. 22321]|uniref:Alpha/beta hydrolase n=1 Tax=Chitinophaga hostae TaxID=2831022 RepID=A0ABS5J9Y1_9BACT|nr:alpha/beta hydrolase [Chitinophaga hostae]MBS0031257.1 alpha/beta hydrolase [Chitinophaga hostae]